MFLIHALLQILDGLLTYSGVLLLGIGTACEGNPIIRTSMDLYGPGQALIVTKTAGVVMVLILRRFREMVMLKYIMMVVNLIYTLSAVYWIYILKDFLWL